MNNKLDTIRIEFLCKGKRYFVYCCSFDISGNWSWFYFRDSVKYIKSKVTVMEVYLPSDSENSLNGETNYGFDN